MLVRTEWGVLVKNPRAFSQSFGLSLMARLVSQCSSAVLKSRVERRWSRMGF